MTKETYLSRIGKILSAMEEKGLDCFLIGPSSNLRYLTGCELRRDERLFLLVLSPGKAPFIIANLLYREQVEQLPVGEFAFWKDMEDPFRLLKVEVEKRGIPFRCAALESSLPSLFSVPIAQTFPQAKFILGNPLTDELRQYKDAEELNLHREACRIADEALSEVMDGACGWIGKAELEFVEALSGAMSRRGIRRIGTVVASGPNASAPHHITGESLIRRGQCLLVDFWGPYQGYYTDMSRTFHFGEPPEEFREIYGIVLEAQVAGEAAAKLGAALGDVDAAARGVIEKSGYGEFFTHRTGHGIGLDDHEGASAGKGEKTLLKPGMVFSVEPGIYLPGKMGVRIEDLVAMTENGAEVLHHFSKALTVIG